MRRFLLAAAALLGLSALAQVATFSSTPADINLTGGVIVFLPDGGCDAQAFFTEPTNRPSTVHHVGPARCTTAFQLFMRAATLDVGVSDGGAP